MRGLGQRRGALSLGTVCLMLTIALMACLTMASQSVFQLSVSQQVVNGQSAHRLACSAVQDAIAHVMINPGWQGEIYLSNDEGTAQLTFKKTGPNVPYSTNNWEGQHPQGWSRGVPQGMIHLIGIGHCRGVERRVEALVNLPVYPLAVACSGAVKVEKSVVASIKDTDLGQPLADILKTEFQPGNMASNSDDAKAITLANGVRVTGYVQALGGIENNGATILGEVRAPWREPATLPDMEAAMLDPRQPADPERAPTDYINVNPVNPSSPNGAYPDLTVSSPTVVEGNLNIDGPLTLQDGILFVTGGLNVTGGILGEGAVGVGGSATVLGRTHFRSSSRIAIVANGNIHLRGTGKAEQVFEGILYSKGQIQVETVTILGACIQNAPAGSPANKLGMVLQDANVLWSTLPAGPSFDPPMDLLMAAGDASLGGTSDPEPFKLSRKSRENDGVFGSTSVRRSSVSQKPVGPGGLTQRADGWLADDVGLLRMFIKPDGTPRFEYRWWGISVGSGLPSLDANGRPLISSVNYDSVDALLNGQDTSNPNLPERLAQGYQRFGNDSSKYLSAQVMRDNLRQTVDNALAWRQSLRRRVPGRNHFSLDPSRFLSRTRAVRVQYWREI